MAKKKAKPAPRKAKAKQKPGPRSTYRPEMIERVLDLGAERFTTKVAIAKALRTSARTLDTWCEQHVEFEEAVAIATEGVWMGRPTKYERAHCVKAIELGRVGKSRSQIAAEFDIARTTLAEWEEQHPEFRIALSRAKDLALAHWENQAEAGVFMGPGGSFNTMLWQKIMEVRHSDEYKPAGLNLSVPSEGGAGGGGIKITISQDDANL